MRVGIFCRSTVTSGSCFEGGDGQFELCMIYCTLLSTASTATFFAIACIAEICNLDGDTPVSPLLSFCWALGLFDDSPICPERGKKPSEKRGKFASEGGSRVSPVPPRHPDIFGVDCPRLRNPFVVGALICT